MSLWKRQKIQTLSRKSSIGKNMAKPLLEIKNLYARVHDKEIIKGLNLTINRGEIHALMGPNGAGKSSLSYILCGKDNYEVTSGEILFKGKNLLTMPAEERARAGLFLSMQSPVEIPGVTVSNFLKHALNSVLKYRNQKELDTISFMKLLRREADKLDIKPEFLKRFVNIGFSGGEKKRFETLQMSILKPDFCILDEIDSGLDVDALKIVAKNINSLHTQDNAFLVITHYQRLLDDIVPDIVHVFIDGKIIQTGNKSLVTQIEKSGYTAFLTKDKS